MTDPVLVTGGAGFIGSHLVEALCRAGSVVRVLDDFSTGRVQHLAAQPGTHVTEKKGLASVGDQANRATLRPSCNR